MIYYERIKDYVALCKRALKKNTPLEQLEALKRARKIMRDDLMDHFTYGKLSHNWVQWWWNAVVCVHYEFINTSLAEMDLYKNIDFDHFMEWVDYLDKSETRYKDVKQGLDLLPNLEKRHPKLLEPNYESFPLLPNEEKPTVTTLDMVFYELLGMWLSSIWRLSREAEVDGQVEKAEDVLPSREYMTYSFIEDLRIRPKTPQKEKMSAFKKAVQETNEQLYPREDDYYFPPEPSEEDDFCPDYDNDDNYTKVEFPPEEVETIVIQEFEERKRTDHPRLQYQLELYLKTAWEILEINDKVERYQALGQLYDDINKENGGYNDELEPDKRREYDVLAENLDLIEPYGKRRKVDALKDYLQRVENRTSESEDVNEFWSWEPVDGIYPAVVILVLLMSSIRKEMRYLHWRLRHKKIPKYQFLEYGYWKEIETDSYPEVYEYVAKRDYVSDPDLERCELPEWITGNLESEESVCVEKITEAPASPSKEVKIQKTHTGNNTLKTVLPHYNLDLPDDFDFEVSLKRMIDGEYLDTKTTANEWKYVCTGLGDSPDGKLNWVGQVDELANMAELFGNEKKIKWGKFSRTAKIFEVSGNETTRDRLKVAVDKIWEGNLKKLKNALHGLISTQD